MWIIAMFDLPVETKEDFKYASQFRQVLLQEGFLMLQFSVYARHFIDEEASEPYKRRIRKKIPPRGEVRLLNVTDNQYEQMEIYKNKERKEPEKPLPPFLLF